jgi:phosphoribosylanthranilate isomerase
VELADRPVILAGGLTPENVKRAILEVRPAEVDSNTGVEDSTGRKSREKSKSSCRKRKKLLRSLKQSSDEHEVGFIFC